MSRDGQRNEKAATNRDTANGVADPHRGNEDSGERGWTSDATLDALVRAAAHAQVDEKAMARAVLARVAERRSRRRWLPDLSSPPVEVPAAALVAALVAVGFGAYSVAPDWMAEREIAALAIGLVDVVPDTRAFRP